MSRCAGRWISVACVLLGDLNNFLYGPMYFQGNIGTLWMRGLSWLVIHSHPSILIQMTGSSDIYFRLVATNHGAGGIEPLASDVPRKWCACVSEIYASALVYLWAGFYIHKF